MSRHCTWCGGNYYEGFECKMCESSVPGPLGEPKATGGPSSYYDMPFSTWITTNDMMEYLAEHKWGRYGIHLKDIFKGICRWGDKSGTTIEYDARKIIYYGVRILQLAVGRAEMREYLLEILDDPQFQETTDPPNASVVYRE